MEEAHVEGVTAVGFYARGTNTASSDLDRCIITENKGEMLKSQAFVTEFGEIDKKQREYYGACISVRVWYKEGIEAEFGLAGPSWIADWLDAGTRRV